jgi:hypothetical protein
MSVSVKIATPTVVKTKNHTEMEAVTRRLLDEERSRDLDEVDFSSHQNSRQRNLSSPRVLSTFSTRQAYRSAISPELARKRIGIISVVILAVVAFRKIAKALREREEKELLVFSKVHLGLRPPEIAALTNIRTNGTNFSSGSSDNHTNSEPNLIDFNKTGSLRYQSLGPWGSKEDLQEWERMAYQSSRGFGLNVSRRSTKEKAKTISRDYWT